MRVRRSTLAIGTAIALSIGCGQSTPTTPESAAVRTPVLLDGIGPLHHPITTTNEEAQRYFDQGLVLSYGFNHGSAIDSFREAARLDPSCAMCQWGIALASGPNINAPMGPEASSQALIALEEAQRLAPGASEAEQAYIAALSPRYSADPAAERAALDADYAQAMSELHRRYPEDLDAATLYAESLMDLSPWNYWTADSQPRERTGEVLELLEGVMASDPQHVGANHYYIHAVEEYFPDKAVAAADRLGEIAPDAGHLVHMPSHIYWRVGRYEDALEINARAVASDEQFFAWCRASAFYRNLYYPHNIHFLWAAASAEGRGDLALSSARKLEAKTRPGLDEMPLVEEFVAIPMLTLARFGRWDEALGVPAPDEQRVYLVGIWHYVRGLAQLRKDNQMGAEGELGSLREVAARAEAEQLILAGGVATARSLLEVGLAHLEGELAAARGEADAAIVALERAVKRQDAIPYMEPPPWYAPSRLALGTVLLEAGRAPEAEAVFRKDLEQYPSSGWSLYGLAQSLRAQGRTSEADWAQQGHAEAFARADVRLEAARF